GNSYTPIVMITGHSEKELQREALKRGDSAFLGKPVDPVAFVSLARNLIQLRDARTGDHCRRVALFAEAIASKMGLSMIVVTQLAQAARIHDIGKLSIPDR